MDIFFGTVIALMFFAMTFMVQKIKELKAEMADDEIGFMQTVDSYEQDFLSFKETIANQESIIVRNEVEHALLSDEIRAHRDLCLPRLHEIRIARMSEALSEE